MLKDPCFWNICLNSKADEGACVGVGDSAYPSWLIAVNEPNVRAPACLAPPTGAWEAAHTIISLSEVFGW